MFILPSLGYGYGELDPQIDAKTMEIHHTKHHQAYVDGLNSIFSKHPNLENKTIEELLLSWSDLPEDIKIIVRNHGGGHFNHSLFWNLLKKDSNTSPTGELKSSIEREFGSVAEFQEQFETAAKTRFGSGWAWLVVDTSKKLKIVSTANQDSPLMDKMLPILGLDVWEHAYYLNYQNRRPDYVSMFWSILNWDQVSVNFSAAI